MPKESIYFGISKKSIADLCEKLGKTTLSRGEVGEFAKTLVREFIEGKTANPDTEYKILRNQKLRIDIKIKERELQHYDTFRTAPSPRAKRAIREGLEPKEETYFDRTENYRLDHIKGKYYFECKDPECGFIAIVFESKLGLEKIEQHLKEKHGLALYKGETIR